MPSLINTDNAGNTFLNYITPLEKGGSPILSTTTPNAIYNDLMIAKLGPTVSGEWGQSLGNYTFRLPSPNEMKGGTGANNAGFARFRVHAAQAIVGVNSHDLNTNVSNYVFARNTAASCVNNNPHNVFAVIGNESFVSATFNQSLSVCTRFIYVGWLREPSTSSPAGVCALSFDSLGSGYVRPATVSTTTSLALSTAANSITSPPIVCTPGTTPGVGTATFTDVVIRDAAAPNNPVGKLWNCIDMPATCNVGELWKNVGAYDGDGGASAQDVYLCVMPWGERKLGMRVWTENVS